MKSPVLQLLALTACAAVFAVACGESGGPTTTAAVPTRRPAAAAADAGTSISQGEPYQYTYVAMGKRDPFRSAGAVAEKGPEGQNPIIDGCDDPLCQFDLDDLRLVAVVSGDANPIAMVEDRTGVGHVVRRNTKVGRQSGKVTAILKDCIVVTSFVLGPDGRSQPNRQNLCVSTEGGPTGTPVLDLMNGKTRE